MDFVSGPGHDDGVPQVWEVGALCRAVADTVDARFNPVIVQGEVSGFSKASSGHCYLSLKDARGQIRCAMFRRAASGLDFVPGDGEQVQVRGRLGVYEQRGDLQLIIESMTRVGQGALFEQFLRLKAKLEGEGLFDAARKRPFPVMPRVIGLVTSLGAAALHDVMTTLQRRAGHVRVILAPAAVQGAQAPAELMAALNSLYACCAPLASDDVGAERQLPSPEGILIVRGGGSLEDLWAFNDEHLVRTVAQSPIPVIAGIGHETDFSLVDFVADQRAPTPTAAAEWVTQDRQVWLSSLAAIDGKLKDAAWRATDAQHQRLDTLSARLGRPSALASRQRMRLEMLAQSMRHRVTMNVLHSKEALDRDNTGLQRALQQRLTASHQDLGNLASRLHALNPSQVLQRGYAWISDGRGRPLTRAASASSGQALSIHLADGDLAVTVRTRPQEKTEPAQLDLI